jgi:H+/Cl- antiporter ClcA/CBS domain-containing protein
MAPDTSPRSVSGLATTLRDLGDFTTNKRVLLLSAIAILIGILGAFVALALLRLIGLFTNLFFYHRWASALLSPADNKLGIWVILVPVAGSLIVGLMARYGSERIRGHGIPEAIEAILIQGSRVQPRLAILKPLSSAISIGSGGPFGAEGPIIMTGGAFGSILAQFMHLTSAERRTLLVAGAAAGMSATFDAPLSSALLAVELLLFEWKPRSFIPVALASGVASAARHYIIGAGPLFPIPAHSATIGTNAFLACMLIGALAGGLSALLTVSVYAAEDAFRKLPIHWMWWPAIGGLVVGTGGYFFPQALGVGYDTIDLLLTHTVAVKILLGILLIKWLIWAVALGSGTSGGVLAPLLLMGGALGGLAAPFLPNEGLGFWPLLSMGAVLGGTMRSPFTGVVFALELTRDFSLLLPLIFAVTVAHAVTVLTMRRSILTEKVSRRGYHLSREYTVDPFEILAVRDVMQTKVLAFPAAITVQELQARISANPQRQRLYPVVDSDEKLIGVVARGDITNWAEKHPNDDVPIRDLARLNPVRTYTDEPLSIAANRMAETGLTRLPVVDRKDATKLAGMLSLNELLTARARCLDDEQRRERVLSMRLLFFLNQKRPKNAPVTPELVPQEHDWHRVRPHQWHCANHGLNAANAKMICTKCHGHIPFDMKCERCGGTDFDLGTAMGAPAVSCRSCGRGQLHWDCPACGHRQGFSRGFCYDHNLLRVA